jgi:adenylate cyclase
MQLRALLSRLRPGTGREAQPSSASSLGGGSFGGRSMLLPGLILLALLLGLRIADPLPVETLRLQVFDTFQRLLPRRQGDEPVLVVAIDEGSLAAIGQWPWPRTIVAELVRRLGEAGAAAVGLDIIFAEPDRTSPPVVADQIPNLPDYLREELVVLPDHDVVLADALRKVPTVLGEVTLAEATGGQGPDTRLPSSVAVLGPDPSRYLPSYGGQVRNLPILEETAKGAGNVDLVPEPDGRARRIPLLRLVGGRMVPAFAAELVRVAKGETTLVVRTTAAGVDALIVGARAVRTDERGRVWVHYAKGDGAGRTVSAQALLAGKVPREQIEGRIVLIGATAVGLGDTRPTPISASMPGVEIHAQLVETILARAGLIRPAYSLGLELLLTLAGGLLVLVFTPRLGALGALILGLGVTLAVLAGAWALYVLASVLIDPSFVIGTCFILWSLAAYLQYLREERARRETAEKLILMRQEAAMAGRIQRAILPQRFPALSNTEVYADTHPAMDVGGDFYDAFVLPDGRLAIVVADVSGKGMAAALFMAVARTVLRSTAAFGSGQCLSRANDLLASDNEACMFVTVFYGVLDPATGQLEYANAGHNPPLLMGANGTVQPLQTTGDLPLGPFEGIEYRTRTIQLLPGQALFLYTDGVTEAFAANGEAYGDDRLHRLLQDEGERNPQHLVERVVAEVQGFMHGAEQSDDITCLAVSYGSRAATEAAQPA